jgi:hypothetical protein
MTTKVRRCPERWSTPCSTGSRGRSVPAGFPGLDPADDPLEFAGFEPWNAA